MVIFIGEGEDFLFVRMSFQLKHFTRPIIFPKDTHRLYLFQCSENNYFFVYYKVKSATSVFDFFKQSYIFIL